ncbi:co-chaperone DjlA [Celerinatantimonas sp. YJH-8]|uniref:co-chaperone DjlA n=1 Tax=Celerinatantimonas sp. YJH-8 TaxID=3228714 RepID=UPI0038C7069F
MRIWGKVIGFLLGLMFGGWFGAIIGLLIGYKIDEALGQNTGFGSFGSTAAGGNHQFFLTTFAVMGHIAKSKGVVTSSEIQVASELMNRMGLQGESRQQAQNAFRDGKRADYPLEDELRRLVALVHGRKDLLQMFLELQMYGVFADGRIDVAEQQMLERIAIVIGFSQSELNRVIARWEAEYRFQQQRQSQSHWSGGERQNSSSSSAHQSLDDAYKLLEINASASNQDVKKAYRRQMNQHHPDKLMSKGLPPEMLEVAKQKAQEIQHAYEMIKQARGMR